VFFWRKKDQKTTRFENCVYFMHKTTPKTTPKKASGKPKKKTIKKTQRHPYKNAAATHTTKKTTTPKMNYF